MRRIDFFGGSRHPPSWAAEALRRFGTNPYEEPIFRVVFWTSRCYLVGGYFEADGSYGYRRIPKYGTLERKWIMEKWVPPSVYGTPTSWEKQTLGHEGYLGLGPFPAHGEYECVVLFSTGRGPEGYVPITPGHVEFQAREVYLNRTLTQWDIRNFNRSHEAMKLKQQDRMFDEMYASVQHTREGLTMGAGGTYSQEERLDAERKRILDRPDLWVNRQDYTGGFMQAEEI